MEVGRLTLLMRVLEGPGGRRAILPRLRAKVVIETRASRHGLGVEVGRERAILYKETTDVKSRNRKSRKHTNQVHAFENTWGRARGETW